MACFEWADEFCTGLAKVDQEHMRLVEIINELHDAMLERRANEAIREIVDEMAEYAASHFSTEERLMLRHNYPRYRQHRLQHDVFTNKVIDLQKRLDEKMLVLSLEVITFLRDWLANHILRSDKELGAFLLGKGIMG